MSEADLIYARPSSKPGTVELVTVHEGHVFIREVSAWTALARALEMANFAVTTLEQERNPHGMDT